MRDRVKRKYLTEVEVAEMIGRVVATLRNDRYHRRGLPFIKIGRSVRYDVEEILAFMAAHQVRTIDSFLFFNPACRLAGTAL